MKAFSTRSVSLCVVMFVMAFLMGCAGPVRQPEMPIGPQLRVVTYNVNYGGNRPDLGVAALRNAGADIVCLQETTPEWERYLRQNFSEDYAHIMFRHSNGAGGQGVLSRFPIDEVAYVPSTSGWFPGWILRARTPVGEVQLLSVHLHPPLGEQGNVSIPAYFSTKTVRREEIQEFHAHLAADVPTIVLGDFNESDSGSAVQWLKRRQFTDALREFDRHTHTWEWPTSLITLRGRYDHILYSPQLHSFQARVIQQGASDHFPVTAIFGKTAGPAKMGVRNSPIQNIHES